MLDRLRQRWPDLRAERWRGALACAVLLIIVLMVVFVAKEAWPTFQHNGLKWLGPGGNVDQQIGTMVNGGKDYHLRAWSLVWGTVLTTGLAVVFGLAFAILASIFIVEFAPDRLRAVIVPVVRLLAAVPSVIFGLIGILVLVPFVGNHVVTAGQKKSVEFVVQLSGASLLVAVVILTIMIVPIMIAIIVDALYAVPRGWKEGAVALGVNRWRAMWTVSVRAARPAIIAAAVLATARALGEAIMLSMVSGSVGFAPNPFDGPLFLLEPLRPLASTIVEDAESLQAPAVRSSVYAFALLLLFSSLFLSLAGFLAKQPMKKYGARI
ncbi:MAG: phosphate transport system permease protein [Baekduia sp.]|nr:phosphate transport system permease protein [Baekduia sp.]